MDRMQQLIEIEVGRFDCRSELVPLIAISSLSNMDTIDAGLRPASVAKPQIRAPALGQVVWSHGISRENKN